MPASFLHTQEDVAALVERRVGGRVRVVARFDHGIGSAVYFAALHKGPSCAVRVSAQEDRDYVALEVWAFGQCRAVSVPVPTVLAYDLAPADFPEPFIITERVDGLLGDSAGLTMRELHAAYEDLGRHMARLHTIALPGYGELQRSREAFAGPCTSWWARLQTELDGYERVLGQYWRGSQVLQRARRRFEAHRALLALPAASLVHGDLQGKNFLVRQGRVAAVLDFECAEAGDPVLDFRVFRYWDDKRESLTEAMLRGYQEDSATPPGTTPDTSFWIRLGLYELLYALLRLTEFSRRSDDRWIEDTFRRIERIERQLDGA